MNANALRRLGPAIVHRAENSDEFICGEDAHPLYEPGIYEVFVDRWERYADPRFHQPKLKVHCHFLYAGIAGDGGNGEIVGFFNLPKAGSISRGYRYYAVYSMANGGPPRRQDRMSPNVLIGKIFRVKVDTVFHPFNGRVGKDMKNWKTHPPELQYSTIEEWLECTGRD